MTLLRPVLHGYLDYLFAAVFLLAPLLLGFSYAAGLLSCSLGIFYLVMTVITDFPLGVFNILPLRLHGWIECALGPLLLLGHFLFVDEKAAHNFYLSVSITIILFRLVSDYGQTRDKLD